MGCSRITVNHEALSLHIRSNPGGLKPPKMNSAPLKTPSWTPEASKSINQFKSYAYIKIWEQHKNFGIFGVKFLAILVLSIYFWEAVTFEPLNGFWCFWCLTGGFQGCWIQFWGFRLSWVTPYVQAHSLMVYRKSAAPHNFWFLLSWILVQSNLISVLPNFTMYIDELVRTFHLRLSIELPWRGTVYQNVCEIACRWAVKP